MNTAVNDTLSSVPVRERMQVPAHPQWPALDDAAKTALKDRIKALLAKRDAALVAHYYVDGDLQALAEETGD
jgi:quinolinate synthase